MAPRVLLVGDSLALGLTGPLTALAKADGIELKGDGRTGTTVKDWVNGGWLAADVKAYAPNITLISLGTNDATGDLSLFASGVSTLIDQATSGGGAVAWIGPPYFRPDLKQFPPGNLDKMRQTLLDVLTPKSIQVFPSDAGGATQDYQRAGDHIHMQPSGYAAWAKDIADFAAFSVAKGGKSPAPKGGPAAKSSGGKWALVVVGIGAAGGAAYWYTQTKKTGRRA